MAPSSAGISPGTLSTRWSRALPFTVTGVGCVVAGGLVAAVTAHAPSEGGTWSAAYLVLVAGVSQVALGAGQAWLPPERPSARLVAVEFSAWNAGNAAVLTGTLLDAVPVVDLGGFLLVSSLALWLTAVRGSGVRGGLPLYAYRLLAAVLLVSVPIGLLLARLG